MLFNSFGFLGFFAVIAVLYYLAPHRWRWVLLLLASYYFYSTFDLKYLLLLAGSTVAAYAVAAWITKGGGKLALTIGVLLQLGVLFVFKYFDFFAGAIEDGLLAANVVSEAIALPRLKLLLPAGLSFYVFSAISYMVDVHRGTVPMERHIGKFAVYIAFFPKLLAGPIERAGSFLTQLSTPAVFNATGVAAGLQLMAWGLFKKVVIADRLAAFVDTGFTNVSLQSPVTVLIAVYFYAFQIYCDFSGYSDIAIGAALVLGFRLMENFKRSYFAKSVPEFWNSRWHLSLARWFRDYLYIPLGGNRVPKWRQYINVMIVFLVSGLWHGSNWTFIIWGGLNGLYQVIYSLLAAPRRVFAKMPQWLASLIAILITFHAITLAWIFFRASSVNSAWAVLTKISGALPQLPTLLAAYKPTGEFYLSIGLIFTLLVVEFFDEKKLVSQRLLAMPRPIRWAFYYAVIFAILVIGVWNTKGFVYMSF
jgi:D-alanyl-lipoteichoic acid acyltransferase DltB (MBOAT superfamily)